MKIRHIAIAACAALMVGSCKTPTNVDYFQDTYNGSKTLLNQTPVADLKLRPKDKIFILVSSKDQVLANLYTLTTPSRTTGTGFTTQGSTGFNINGNYQTTLPYTIDNEGFINFPVVGPIKVADMTRQEVAAHIQNRLRNENFVNDAVVTVEYQNLQVSVLGEVARPGNYFIDRDNYSVLDAITSAGDLTINGVRDNVRVLRREGDKEVTYYVNLLSADSTFNSPAYYLHQNDIVYVEPNDMVKRQTVNNANNVRSTSFWFSSGSLLVSLAVLFFK